MLLIYILLGAEGKEMLAIPSRLYIEIKQVVQHWNQDGHGQNDNVGNVQILERMVRGGKNETIALYEGGLMKLQQCVNQVARQKEGEMAPIFRKYLGMFDESNYCENARNDINCE